MVREAGRFTVKNLGVIGWMLRFTDITAIAKRFTKSYHEVYKFGDVKVLYPKEDQIVIRFWDVLTYPEAYECWLGVLEGGMEITKTKGTVKVTKSTLDGAEYAEIVIDYE